MKRDMELIRQILHKAEALGFHNDEPPAPYRAKTVDEAYQIALMQDAGLVVAGSPTTIAGGIPYEESIIRLTWAGHDFLDSTRDSNIWNKAKEQVLKSGASWTFDILKEWVKYELKQRLGLPHQ